MTIFEIFKQAVELGVKHDFRPRDEVLSYYWQERIKNKMGQEVVNSYADTGIVWCDNLDQTVQRVAIGLDVGQDEILTIQEWEEKNNKTVDLFISHHPRGRVVGTFPHVLKTQLGNLSSQGVKTAGLEKYYDKQLRTEQEETRAANPYRTLDTLRILKKNFVSIHTPFDNMAARFVEQYIKNSGARTLHECTESLLRIPEYEIFFRETSVRPVMHVGKGREPLGKFLLTEFTGGEEGPTAVYQRMRQAGFNTLVVMHISQPALREARKRKLNVISAGHMCSDSVGLNLFCDILETKGIEIIPLGGLIRYSRLK